MMRRVSAVLLMALLTSSCGYNRIQELDEQTEQMKSNIDTELQRRNDLIPNLVATVDEVARFEQETQTGVAQARSGLSQVQRNLDLFINVAVEAYPTLRANENFTRLQDELTETENRISVARRDYNEAVTTYNTYIRRFPQLLTAKMIGAEQRDQFEAPEAARTAPTVEFD